MPETAVRHLTTGHFNDFAEGFVKGGSTAAPCPLEIQGQKEALLGIFWLKSWVRLVKRRLNEKISREGNGNYA